MIDFYVTGQSIRFASPVIAANSRDYLRARFHFGGEEWEGYSKWAHFRQGETVYDLNLENDEIQSERHLNLSIGQWEVYLTGVRGESRLTTVPVILSVRESGLIDEPLHPIPMTVAEQIDSKASLALERAEALQSAMESGALDGKSFQILGYYQSLEELTQAVTAPERGDAYGIGTQAPYDIYVYDGLNELWVNNGSIQGARGEKGESGATFSPVTDENGNLSWVNDKGLPNPPVVNIRGAQGEKGENGADGKSPYALAAEEGFSGTEATFNWSLAHIAGHARQHEAGGTDPLEIGTDSIAPGAVTTYYAATIGTAWAGEEAPFTQIIPVPGMMDGDRPIADLVLSETMDTAEKELEAWAAVLRITAEDGSIKVYAAEKTEAAMNIQMVVMRR